MAADVVWIVQQDSTPDNCILGVFATHQEACELADIAETDYPGQVIIGQFYMGYKYTEGSSSV